MSSRQYSIRLPELGLGRAEVRASVWLAPLGAKVVRGDRVLEVVSDGVTVDLPSPATGRLVRRAVAEEDVLHVGQVLGVVEGE